MADSRAFRYTGEVVDSEGRTWEVDHDYTLSAGAEGDPWMMPVIFTGGGKPNAANVVARGRLSDAEYLVRLRMQQEAERHTREGNGRG